MQYKVPQNIDIEDRVISFMTLRQFMVLLVGAMITLLFRGITSSLPGITIVFYGAPIMGAAGVMAFYRYNDKPLEVFIAEASRSLIKARRRVWKKEEYNPNAHPMIQVVPQKKETNVVHKAGLGEAKGEFESLAKLVDSGGYAGQSVPEIPKPGEEILIDTLMAAEQPKATLVDMLQEAKVKVETKVEKEEPRVSQLASVSPYEKLPGYENEPVVSDEEVNRILKQIRRKEEENVAALSRAQVSSFHKNLEFQTE